MEELAARSYRIQTNGKNLDLSCPHIHTRKRVVIDSQRWRGIAPVPHGDGPCLTYSGRFCEFMDYFRPCHYPRSQHMHGNTVSPYSLILAIFVLDWRLEICDTTMT
jgi:hypothetical protein